MIQSFKSCSSNRDFGLEWKQKISKGYELGILQQPVAKIRTMSCTKCLISNIITQFLKEVFINDR